MNSWGYISIGLICAVVAGVLLAAAQPSDLDFALAAAEQAMGNPVDEPEVNLGLQLAGYLFALAAAVLTSIGVIAEGVRIGQRQASYSAS